VFGILLGQVFFARSTFFGQIENTGPKAGRKLGERHWGIFEYSRVRLKLILLKKVK
jgi:hypothetical protein